MADGLSIAASVIAVAGLAYSSSKMLYQTISDIRDAPETFVHLKTDVETLYRTILPLQQGLEKHKDTDAALSEAQKLNLREIKPALEACRNACDTFKSKIDRVLSNSRDSHISLRDKLKLQFQEKEIGAFQARLGSFKSTLAIALDFSILKTTAESLESAKALEKKIEDVASCLTGQMQGLQIGLQAILDTSADSHQLIKADPQSQLTDGQQSEVARAIEQQSIPLWHCYNACMAAFVETTKATGHTYRYWEISDQANLIMGNLGDVKEGPLNDYRNIKVTGGRVVGGNVAGAVQDFFQH